MSEIANKNEHYDVGIFGVWSGCNYGSVATYYALNQVVSSMGKTVLMIDKPIITEDDAELKETHSRRFGREHYNISKQYKLEQMHQLNNVCDSFLIGSDQVWNYGISKNVGKAFWTSAPDLNFSHPSIKAGVFLNVLKCSSPQNMHFATNVTSLSLAFLT